MGRSHDWDDDEIDPHGPKNPMAFLAPTLRLLAVGSRIVIPKFSRKAIHASAKAARVRVRLEVMPDRIRLTVTEKIVPSKVLAKITKNSDGSATVLLVPRRFQKAKR